MSTTQAADVVIIGGGIVGLSAAYFLARRKQRVVLVDKGRLAWEQSSRNWGFVRQQGRDPIELPMVALSNRIWCGISEELDADTEWRQGGNLALAATEEDLERYAQGAQEAQAAGIETHVLTREQVQGLLPQVHGPYVGGLHTPSDGPADPLKGTLACAKGAQREGADLREYCAVESITTTGGRVSGVSTTQGEIRAAAVVCAAGAHSAHLARLAGLNLPQRAVRSSVVATAPVPHLTDLGVWVQGVGFRQARDGSLILGKASAGTADHDVTLETFRNVGLFLPNYLKNRDLFRLRFGMPLVRDILRHLPGTAARRHPFAHLVDAEPPVNPHTVAKSVRGFEALFPHLAPLRVARTWAGIIDATPDLVPVLGEVRARPGLFFATGFSGHGFGLGPGAGQTIAELITDGRTALDIRRMRFERFAERDLSQARKIL